MNAFLVLPSRLYNLRQHFNSLLLNRGFEGFVGFWFLLSHTESSLLHGLSGWEGRSYSLVAKLLNDIWLSSYGTQATVGIKLPLPCCYRVGRQLIFSIILNVKA